MSEKRDYYEILGVNKTASQDELKKSFRSLSKKFHPDANPDNPEAEAKFKEINEAYSILNDPQKKAAYDRLGHAAFEQGGSNKGFDFDMNDIFSSIFSGGFNQRQTQSRGADVKANIKISFEEAYFGTTKEIQIEVEKLCNTCKGSGAKSESASEKCKQCNGNGRIPTTQQTPLGIISGIKTCTTCNGKGKIIKEQCPTCKSAGKIIENQKLAVKIPRGINDNQMIKLAGKGRLGAKGMPSGDLLLFVLVQPHKTFNRMNDDLFLEFPITFIQAILGDKLSIPTMEGNVSYDLKAGTQTDTGDILKGRGFPNVQNPNHVGNLIVKFNVVIPTNLTDKQREILQEFVKTEEKIIN